MISLLDNLTTGKIVDLEWPPFLDEGIDDNDEFNRSINVLGPVNGIYCIVTRLVRRWVNTLVLWNPTTREYNHIVPVVGFPFSFDFFTGKLWNWCYELKRPIFSETGFGFDTKTNDFKVVVICYWSAFYGNHDERWHVRVYDHSSTSGRTIHYLTFKGNVLPLFKEMDPFFPQISSYPEVVHCHLNGVLHWSASWDAGKGILAFDMANESFQLIKGPPLHTYELPCRSVWVLKETLAFVVSNFQEGGTPCSVDVWMMMQYGVEESWTILYSFEPKIQLTFVGILNDDQIFFRDERGQLVSTSFEHNKEFKKYVVYSTYDSGFHLNAYGGQGVLKTCRNACVDLLLSKIEGCKYGHWKIN